ncbi:TetR/AcrR family transcriptional regulator [Neorhizobium sp. NCHU2750]|uniref:TetR/AcrR family transcriptional regulator n=1 Tax=Neorhizobium sp. NCHU2750 TaxID=1825976 RepID=UPI000E72EE2F|nr:TetR family transcriptional regulator [Neorhizobium sp. NCHU2750]
MKTQYERADVVPLLAEVFRELGYEGTSLNRITERTGIGKGSLYHFFPGGKEEMAAAVLADVDQWFEREIFLPLESGGSDEPIARMWLNVTRYFRSGGRVCLVGAFALDATRDRFAAAIRDYFARWIAALAAALEREGASSADAKRSAEDAVLTIQGAIVLSRSLDDPEVFIRAMDACRHRIEVTRS